MGRARRGGGCVLIRLRPLLLGVAAVIAPLGCAIIAGINDDRVLDPVMSTCPVTKLPIKPTGASGDTGPDFTVAIRTMDLGEGPNASDIGLDLDLACTCPGPPSCAEPAWATDPHCDGTLGRDNAAGHGFGRVNGFIPGTISSMPLSVQISQGNWSLLIRVRGYSGQDDDSDVEVDIYPTAGMPNMAPNWDGNDAWPIADTAVGPGMNINDPLFVDKQAYVTQKTLVARLPSALILILGDLRLDLMLSAVVLTAQIEQTPSGKYRLSKGTIAGLWALPEVFKGLSSFRYNAGTRLCTDDGLYPSVRDELCAVVDIKASPMSAGCDAISFGMGFESDPAMLGSIVPVPAPLGGPCPPADGGASTDPISDSCGP